MNHEIHNLICETNMVIATTCSVWYTQNYNKFSKNTFALWAPTAGSEYAIKGGVVVPLPMMGADDSATPISEDDYAYIVRLLIWKRQSEWYI